MTYGGCTRKHTPIVSKAQRRFMGAAMRRGEIPRETVMRHFAESRGKKLPERVHRRRGLGHGFRFGKGA